MPECSSLSLNVRTEEASASNSLTVHEISNDSLLDVNGTESSSNREFINHPGMSGMNHCLKGTLERVKKFIYNCVHDSSRRDSSGRWYLAKILPSQTGSVMRHTRRVVYLPWNATYYALRVLLTTGNARVSFTVAGGDGG